MKSRYVCIHICVCVRVFTRTLSPLLWHFYSSTHGHRWIHFILTMIHSHTLCPAPPPSPHAGWFYVLFWHFGLFGHFSSVHFMRCKDKLLTYWQIYGEGIKIECDRRIKQKSTPSFAIFSFPFLSRSLICYFSFSRLLAIRIHIFIFCIYTTEYIHSMSENTHFRIATCMKIR